MHGADHNIFPIFYSWKSTLPTCSDLRSSKEGCRATFRSSTLSLRICSNRLQAWVDSMISYFSLSSKTNIRSRVSTLERRNITLCCYSTRTGLNNSMLSLHPSRRATVMQQSQRRKRSFNLFASSPRKKCSVLKYPRRRRARSSCVRSIVRKEAFRRWLAVWRKGWRCWRNKMRWEMERLRKCVGS